MTYNELKAILERAGKRGVHLYGAQSPPVGTQLIRSTGTQVRTVRRDDKKELKRVRRAEPVAKGYSTALIGGHLQTVKV